MNYRWRTHSRLFRLILERTNPRLAEMETADGGPASPMRLANMHRFLPYGLDAGEKLLWKLGYKYLGKTLWNKRDAGPDGTAYPLAQWLQDTAVQLQEHGLLDPNKMQSAELYDSHHLQALLDGVARGVSANETLLSRIITVEIALRFVGTSI